MNPRWQKLRRDLASAQGRLAMIVVAIALSVAAVGAILSAYAILMREIDRNYLGTNPATAWIEVATLDDGLTALARTRPGVIAAESGAFVTARARVGGKGSLPLIIFVVPDFAALQLNRFSADRGAWPPPDGALLVERDVLDLIDARIGDVLTVQTNRGDLEALSIAGTVHDPGLAPAWQEQTVYAYATPATVASLGETPQGVLKVKTEGDAATVVTDLAVWLGAQGVDVDQIRIPPAKQHPHQSQLTTILALLLTFSVLAVVLSAILTATLVDGLLAQQIRQIGIMKAVGARVGQITWLYAAAIAALGGLASLIALPVGWAVGRAFAGVVAELLNLRLASLDVPVWVAVGEIALGLGVPTVIAWIPVRRAARTPVRETLSDYGVDRATVGSGGLDAQLQRLAFLGRTFNLSLRNAFRKRGRLTLTVALLSVGGALFLTGLNTQLAWDNYVAEAAAERHYDLEIRLREPAAITQVRAALRTVSDVAVVEAWDLAAAAPARADGLIVVRTYPDGGHGSLTVRAAPVDTELIALPLLRGSWLSDNADDAVVLNQNAVALFPNAAIGDPVALVIDHRPVTFRLGGVIRQILTPATAFVTPEALARALGSTPDATQTVRVRFGPSAPSADAVEAALLLAGVKTRLVISEGLLEDAGRGHVLIFIAVLLAMAGVMAVVGGLGLTSVLGASVIERTREFGVLRAIGARSSIVQRNVIGEGLVIGALGGLAAVLLALPLSWGVGALLGTLSFRVPLPLAVSPTAIAVWLGLVAVIAVVASLVPARAAARLTVREALAYV